MLRGRSACPSSVGADGHPYVVCAETPHDGERGERRPIEHECIGLGPVGGLCGAAHRGLFLTPVGAHGARIYIHHAAG